MIVYESMQVFDPTLWDCADKNYNVQQLKNFDTDRSKTLSVADIDSWEALHFLSAHIKALDASALWRQVLS